MAASSSIGFLSPGTWFPATTTSVTTPRPGAPDGSTVDADRHQRSLERCGIVTLEFANGASPQPMLVEPDGLMQLTLTDNVPDPYGR